MCPQGDIGFFIGIEKVARDSMDVSFVFGVVTVGYDVGNI